jgi:probable F420-dependent oxidoreductase
MKIGAHFPGSEIGNDHAAVRDWAQTAEGLGFTHLLAFDHVLGGEPGGAGSFDRSSMCHEALTLLAFLAGVTRDVGLMTGVLILPQRQTVLVAKQAAEIDILSGGRLRLGIGTGWNKVEYDGLGQDFHDRGARQAEQVELMRRLWTEENVDFTGRWHHVDHAGINPRPLRPIPIWFGGWAEAALRRAARLGDGWIAGGGPHVLALVPRVRDYVREAGRDVNAFGMQGSIGQGVNDPERWRRQIVRWREVGASNCSFDTTHCGFTSPVQHIDSLHRFAEVRDSTE